jgi:hypothetical protein
VGWSDPVSIQARVISLGLLEVLTLIGHQAGGEPVCQADSIVDLCETKFTAKPFALDEDYDRRLLYRRETFCDETGTDKAVHIVMISASGLTPGSRTGMLQNVVTLDDLFA